MIFISMAEMLAFNILNYFIFFDISLIILVFSQAFIISDYKLCAVFCFFCIFFFSAVPRHFVIFSYPQNVIISINLFAEGDIFWQ